MTLCFAGLQIHGVTFLAGIKRIVRVKASKQGKKIYNDFFFSYWFAHFGLVEALKGKPVSVVLSHAGV